MGKMTALWVVVGLAWTACGQDIPGWESKGGTWTFSNGVVTGQCGYLIPLDDTPSDFVVSTAVRVEQWKDGVFGFHLRSQDPGRGMNCYRVLFRSTNQIALDKVVNGQWKPWQTEAIEIPTGQWYHVRIVGRGPTITCSYQDKELLRLTDPEPIKDGKIVLWVSKETTAQFKDVQIGALTDHLTRKDRDEERPGSKPPETPPAKPSGPSGGSELPGAKYPRAKSITGKAMWYWSNDEQHVLVVPYQYFNKSLDDVLKQIFGEDHHVLAVGIYNEYGKGRVSFNLCESLTVKMQDGRLFGSMNSLEVVYKDLGGKIDILDRERRENEDLKVYLGFKVLDTFDDKRIYERAKRQNLTSVENIEKRNKVLEAQIATLRNLQGYFKEVEVGPGERRMCLMILRSKLKLSKIHSVYLRLASGEAEQMPALKLSRKTMEDCGIGDQ